ncbi:MAG TPA: hypothetical protein VLX29_05320 [Nitrospirota bacterium]|nr:hypothetical protein [Nitrospirota bacterium]
MKKRKEIRPQNESTPENAECEDTLKIRPTLAEIAIAKSLLKGATQAAACRAAGYAPTTSYYHSTEIINRPGVQIALAEGLKRAGGTKEKIARTMVAGMDATKRAHDAQL